MDTGVLVALRDPSHPRHEAAMKELARGTIVVSRGSLAEFTTVVRRLAKDSGRDGNQEARAALAALRKHPAYRAAADVSDDDVAATYAKDRALSLVDAWNITAAKREGERLLSFDRAVRRYATS